MLDAAVAPFLQVMTGRSCDEGNTDYRGVVVYLSEHARVVVCEVCVLWVVQVHRGGGWCTASVHQERQDLLRANVYLDGGIGGWEFLHTLPERISPKRGCPDGAA